MPALDRPIPDTVWAAGARYAGLATLVLGILVVFGWLLGIRILTEVFLGLSSMKPNTAVGLALDGAALWRMATAKRPADWTVATALALGAAVIAGLTLIEYMFGVDLGIDQLILTDTVTPADNLPGRMSVVTAFCFILFATATASCPPRTMLRSSIFLISTILGAVVSYAALLGYVLHSQLLYDPFPSASIALHTASGFFIAFIGLNATQPQMGFPSLLRSNGPGGMLARRLVPTVLLVVPLVARMYLEGSNANLYDTETKLGLLTLTGVAILMGVVWFTGTRIDLLDQARRTSEERYRHVVDEIQEAIWVHAEGRILFANRHAAQLLGVQTPEELIGQDSGAMVHPDDRALSASRMAALEQGAAVPVSEIRLTRPDGNVIRALVHAIPIMDQGRRCILSSARDVTAQRDAEEQLRQSQKMESVGRLTGGIAHDFNNLLTVIMGNAELLIESQLNDTQKDFAETILRTGGRGAELISQMLAFSRQQPLRPRSIDANGLMQSMEAILKRILGEDINLKMDIAKDLWPLFADPAQVETAILNLAVNARHAMANGGKLTIEIANVRLDEDYCRQNADVRPGEYVLLAVTDTGTGMPPEVVERAFEPFFTTKAAGHGTGLGLSMIFGFAKQSGGHVKIYSEIGEGTTVKLYLPRDAGLAEAQQSSTVTDVPVQGTECILLVEDEENVRQLATNQLARFGYRVIPVADGPSALAALSKEPQIDLLFTDVVLPGGMNGRQLAERIQELRPEIRVLYASGYTENAIVHQGRLDPGVHLLAKPYRSVELGRMVRRVLDDR